MLEPRLNQEPFITRADSDVTACQFFRLEKMFILDQFTDDMYIALQSMWDVKMKSMASLTLTDSPSNWAESHAISTLL